MASNMFINSRPHRADILLMQVTDQQVSEADGIDIGFELAQTNGLSHERFTDESFASSPANFTIAADLPDVISCSIPQRRQTRRELAWTPSIALSRRLLSQSFMGTLTVVLPKPAGATMLLTSPSSCCRLGRFGFEHPVKLLMRTVVLRLGWPDKLHPNVQASPPRAQLRKPGRPTRGKGAAIVHADHLRQTMLLKKPRKNSLGWGHLLAGQDGGQQTITAERVPHRQGFTTLAITRPKPTFEICGPYVVGPARQSQPRMANHTGSAWTATAAMDQLQPTQPAPSGPDRRGMPPSPLKPCPQLLGSPRGMLLPQPPDPFNPFAFQPPRHALWTSALWPQASGSFRQKSRPPLIGGLATDAKNPAPTLNRLFVPEQRLDHAPPLPNLCSCL